VKNDGFNGRFQRGMLTSEKNPQFNGEKTCSEDFALEKSAGPCIYRHTDTTKSRANKIAVFGDSHSYSLSPIFIDISKTTNRQIVHMGLGGCPPLIGIDVVKGNYPLGTCTALVERQLQLAQQGDISTVILVGRWSLYTNGSYEGRKRNYFLSTDETKTQSIESSTEAFKKGFERTLDTYSKMGIKVVIVEQAPMQTVSPGRIYARLATDDELSEQTISSVVSKYSVGWEKHELFQQKNRTIIRELVGRYQSSIVSFDEIFCDEKACLLGDNKNAYYTDFDHLSAYGAMKVKEKLTEKLLEK
jgi:hypothetical protein